jgi:hypothetical protein
VLLLLALLALSPAALASAQSATQTYTPIPTRTPIASTQPVVVINAGDGTATFAPSMTAGDAFVVISIAALFALGALYWAWTWVKSHVRTQEQG